MTGPPAWLTLPAVLPVALAAAAAALAVPAGVHLRVSGQPVPARAPAPVALAVAGAAGLLLSGAPRPLLVVPALLAGLGLAVVGLVRVRRRASARRDTAARVREGCEALAEELAAGADPERALARVVGDWPSVEPVLTAHRVGLDVPAAWRRVAEGSGAGGSGGADGLRLVAAAWQVSGRTGQGLAAALSRVAEDLRAAESSRRVVESELASARATGRLVAGLPVVAWLMGSGSGGDPLAWLLGGPAGWVCLALGGGLLLGGLAWIELLARSVER